MSTSTTPPACAHGWPRCGCSPRTLRAVLLPHVQHPVGGLFVRDAIEQQMTRLEAVGTYFPTHAMYVMRLARARHAVGDVVGAHEAWERSAVYLAAYGWRKDVTV